MSTAFDSQEWCLIASSTTVAFRLSKISSCSLEVLDFCKILLNSSCRVSHPIYTLSTQEWYKIRQSMFKHTNEQYF